MSRFITLLLASALTLTGLARGQSAQAELFAKTDDDRVLVAIRITPDLGCYFYDQGEDTGGMPTTVELGGLDGEWSDVWFPDAKIKIDPLIGESRVFEKTTVLYAFAEAVGDEPDVDSVTAAIKGQVCNEMACMPWNVSLDVKGAGDDDVWAGFANAFASPASTAGESDGSQADSYDDIEIPTWTPDFGEEKALGRAFARANGDEVEIVVQMATPEHWHMYHGPTNEDMGPGLGTPTTIEVDGGNVDWDEPQHPRPYRHVQDENDVDGWLWAYEGTFHFGISGEAYDDFDPEDVTITVTGQSCDEACVPVSLELEIEGEGDEGMYKAAFASWTLPEIGVDAVGAVDGSSGHEATAAPEGADGEKRVFGQETESDGLLKFILLAIGAGLFTLLMPCTYPMIPITISYFTKQADARGGKVLPLALVYGAGIVLMFVLIAVIAGPLIQPFATHPLTNFVIGVVFVLFALALFGMITLNPPKFLMNFAGQASTKGGYNGVFLMGLTLVVTSFTCTGPFVGSLLAAGADLGTAKIALGMAFFGLTMATPFVFLALVPGKLSTIPSAGAWMNTVKVFMGFVELAASIKFFSNADIALGLMILPREVFLILWAGIAFIAGFYLLGRINLKGESPDGNIGPLQMTFGTGTILLGGYFFLGVVGYKLDGVIMSAMAPPESYTRGLVESHQSVGGAVESLPEGIKREGGSLVVIDDYDLARDYAIENGLGLLANFTGHT